MISYSGIPFSVVGKFYSSSLEILRKKLFPIKINSLIFWREICFRSEHTKIKENAMTIKKLLLLGSLTLFALSARATIFTGPVADDAYVTFGGYDLAWASPCSDGILEPSCGAIDMSEQSAYGWQVMT